jgi:hypothetical protein
MMCSKEARGISYFILIILLILTIFVTTVNAAQVTWTIVTVDVANHVGEYCSIKIDSNNHIHIAYYDDYWKDLKYALSTDDGHTWSIGPVDTGDGQSVGKFCSLALDSYNRPHISYFDETNYYLKYAKWTGSTWSLTTIDNLSGGYTSIVLDNLNNPHISYYDYDLARLKYAYWNGTTWLTKTVDSPSTGPGSVGEGSAIALDSNNRPQIVYRSTYPDQLKFAKWTGTTWNIQVVDNVAVLDPSITLDYYDVPYISYYDVSSGNLIYTAWTISFWYKETVDASADVGRWSSIALDSIGIPHISYYDVYWGDLKYAKMEPGIGWLIRTIDTVGDMGFGGTSLVLDSSDHVHISYNDATNHNLKYARDPDETFSVTGYEGFDSNGDQHDDSLLIFLDVNTSYGGSLNVRITALLYDPSGQNIVDNTSSIVTITGNQVETNNVTLTVLPNSPEGLYTFKLLLRDEIGNLEDTITFNNAAYLYPLDATPQTGYLQGTVTDLDTSLPLEGSQICVDDPSASTVQAVTNATGQYWIQLTEGEHEITVTDSESSLYFYESANVTIVHDTITTQDFQLQRSNWILFVYVVGSGVTETDPPSSNTFPVDSWVQVEAFPDSEWILDYWLLDFVNAGSENPFSVLMDSDHNLTAVFTEGEPSGADYDLTVAVTGSGSTSPGVGVYSYNEGSSVSITASAASGWTFNHWLLDSANVGNENPYSLTMDADHSLTAVFTEVSEEENQRPHAFLSVNSTTINVNEVVLCNASESYDSDGQIMLYFFDFGDETNTGWITSSSISHSYMTEGEYSINLIVEDDQGLTNSSEFTLSVIITVIPEFSSYIILAFAIMILMISIFKRKINNNP